MHPDQSRLTQRRLSGEGQTGSASHLEQRLDSIGAVDQDRHLETPRAVRVANEGRIQGRRVGGSRDRHIAIDATGATVGHQRTLGHFLLTDLEHKAHLRLDLLKLTGTRAIDRSRASVGEILTLDVDRNRADAQVTDTRTHLTSLVQIGRQVGVGGLVIVSGRGDTRTLDLGNRLPLRDGKQRELSSRTMGHYTRRIHVIVSHVGRIGNGGRGPTDSSRKNQLHGIITSQLFGLRPLFYLLPDLIDSGLQQ